MSEKVINMRTSVTRKDGWMHRIIDSFRDWNMRRIAKAELQSLPTHLLNDIGVSRGLINDYVDGIVVRRGVSVASVVDLDRPAAAVADVERAKAA